MKFLVIAQDLRVSGTSEGIVSRSFISKLRIAYPDSIIDVVYLGNHENDDKLDLLPVNNLIKYSISHKIPFFTRWLNKVYWRLFHVSLNERYIQKLYAFYIRKIDYEKYDHIFIRSTGLEYETILGAKDLPILKKAIINFHDPYPVFWNTGSKNKLSVIELFRLKEMLKVVQQAKECMSPARLLSCDMEHLYGTNKKFHVLPHQFSESVFDFSDIGKIIKKNKKINISHHGAIQFARNVDILIEAYKELIENNSFYKKYTELSLRLGGFENKRLISKYSECSNIIILDTIDFCNSSQEQTNESDILIILENCCLNSNILGGKVPFIASINKPLLSLSPERSEIRMLLTDNQFIANCDDREEIKQKLENLIINRLNSNEPVFPFGDYFGDKNFKKMLDKILFENNEN